ncbi:hypothetical protein ACFPJ1_24630 [Kribbella qitaiheensis]|uniref:hypothetical protein n=1 Tax=Kribbella qitaiheensis TaxID=1544730 RepID=UPI00360EA6B8
MRIDRSPRDVELLADLLVRVTEREQMENLALTIADRFERRLPIRDDELRSQIGIDVAFAGATWRTALINSVSDVRWGT